MFFVSFFSLYIIKFIQFSLEKFDYYAKFFEYVINKKLLEELKETSVKKKVSQREVHKLNQTDEQTNETTTANRPTFWSIFRGKEFIVSFTYLQTGRIKLNV